MKEDDEGGEVGDEDCVEGVEGDDEGSEWLILSCLRGFENKQTIGHLKMGTFKKEWFS